MPAPLPPDQLTIIRNHLAKGDTAGAVRVYMEATGATETEAKAEVNNLASRYGFVGAQVPDLFVRRTPPPPPKSAQPVEAPPAPVAPPATPATPAPVAQQSANVPIESAPAPVPAPAPPPAPAPAPVTISPDPEAAAAAAPAPAAPPVSIPRPAASQPSPAFRLSAEASSPAAKKSRWGCSSVIVLSAGMLGVAWWVFA
jgi:hypothetical protein